MNANTGPGWRMEEGAGRGGRCNAARGGLRERYIIRTEYIGIVCVSLMHLKAQQKLTTE